MKGRWSRDLWELRPAAVAAAGEMVPDTFFLPGQGVGLQDLPPIPILVCALTRCP